MHRRARIVGVLSLLAAFCVTAQVTASPEFRLFLPANDHSNEVEVRYVLYGSFGAQGGFAQPARDLQSIGIPLSVEGVVASHIKLFAWAPGCQIATFESNVEALDIQSSYFCRPLPNTRLNGRIEGVNSLGKTPVELRVYYVADWACAFFGFQDCMVPQWPLGIVELEKNGSFAIDLPDFADDPTVSGSKLISRFQFVLREAKTGNLIAFLEPRSREDRSAGGGLKPASAYSKVSVFTIARDMRVSHDFSLPRDSR